MHNRLKQQTDEIVLAQALIYFVFVGTLALIATFFARGF